MAGCCEYSDVTQSLGFGWILGSGAQSVVEWQTYDDSNVTQVLGLLISAQDMVEWQAVVSIVMLHRGLA